MTRPKVKLVSPGVRNLLSDPGVKRDLEARGQRVLGRMIAECPIESGALRASLGVKTYEEDRAVVVIGSDLDYALRIAAVTGFMSRALDAAR